ncbi:MAG: sugar ABC transporter substrate-binding protein [Caldilineaceae bacterium]
MKTRMSSFLLLSLLLLAACTPVAPSAAPAGEGATGGEISLLAWTISPEMDKALQDQAAKFSETHPGSKVNVTLVPYDQFNTKLTLMLSSGEPPDLSAMPSDIMAYAKDGQVIALDDLIAADPTLSDPAKSRTDAYDLVRFDGQHIAVSQYGPLCGMQLYYNKDLFDKAGVAYPSDAWTWDDFLAAAKQLTVREGDQASQWGVDLGYLLGWDGGWDVLAWSNGAKLLDTNFQPQEIHLEDPNAVAGLQYLQDLVYKDKVAPSPAERDALSQAGGAFLSGKVAMIIDGCWMLSSYKGGDFALGMSVIPQGSAGRANAMWYAAQLVIYKESKHQDLAWEFAKWLAVDEEANKMMAATGQNCGAPIVRQFDDLYNAAWKDVTGGEACVKSLDNAHYGSIYATNWQEIWDTVISPEWDKFLNGSITAQQFVDTVDPKVDEMLKKQ